MRENSRENIQKFGEVFTPKWLIDEMLALVEHETLRVESTFLEPSCGDGRVLCAVLEKKLQHCKKIYSKNNHHRTFFSFVALSSIYGIDIQIKNVEVTRKTLFALFLKSMNKHDQNWITPPAQHVISKNIMFADALIASRSGSKLLVSQWSPISTSHIQRQDFYFHNLFMGQWSGNRHHDMGKNETTLIRPADVTFKSRRIVDLTKDA